ncbi:MAG: holo-ACP synthase [Deltaproteobacteria bacterium]|nr:holo-ACP synthase [Deltaproteobacteria bacterium]
MTEIKNQITTGIDIVSIRRIRKSSRNPRFCEGIFTKGELAYSMKKRSPPKHLAGRFAAKEACVKALSFAPEAVFGWKDIEVVNDGNGRPAIRLHSGAVDALGGRKIFLSITYSKEAAMAFVAVEQVFI